MHPNIETLIQQRFQLSSALPATYRGMALPGGEVVAAQGDAGMLVFQQSRQAQYTIRFNALEILNPFTYVARQSREILVSFLALKNNIRYTIQGLGSFNLRQGQFALLHTREQEIIAHFYQANQYQHLEIAWSSDIINQVLPLFPHIQAHLSTPTPTSLFIGTPGKKAGSGALHIAHELLHTSYEENIRQLLFEYKVREYLLLLLVESGQPSSFKSKLTQDERDRVLVLGEKLRHETAQKFPIAELTIEAFMNERKLNAAFKELFGKSIFEFQLEARMKEAHRLLEETDLNTKVIAGLVGYELTTSFITKFREYFGYPPSQVSKRP